MSFPPNSFTGGPAANGQARSPRGPGRGNNATINLALDNLLRNELRVNNPRDAKQIAAGLQSYYQDHPQALGMRQEVMGVANLPAPLPSPGAVARSSSDTEFGIANGDVEKALGDLASNALTNDITPEMNGWADSIRAAITQGHSVARNGRSLTQRAKVRSVRREFGEYARMARLVGWRSLG